MEEKKIYTSKDFIVLVEKLKESAKAFELPTHLFGLLLSVTPELGEGKNSVVIEEHGKALETFIELRKQFLEDIEEHEKILAELKEAVLYISSAYAEDIEEK